MSYHDCAWNCGGTDCPAPRHNPRSTYDDQVLSSGYTYSDLMDQHPYLYDREEVHTNANYRAMHVPPPPQEWDNAMLMDNADIDSGPSHVIADIVLAVVYVLALAAVFADVFWWRP